MKLSCQGKVPGAAAIVVIWSLLSPAAGCRQLRMADDGAEDD